MSSAIVDKYIGESARIIREMFGLKIIFSYALQQINQKKKVMQRIMSLVSFSWTKSMLLEESDSQRVNHLIVKFKEL